MRNQAITLSKSSWNSGAISLTWVVSLLFVVPASLYAQDAELEPAPEVSRQMWLWSDSEKASTLTQLVVRFPDSQQLPGAVTFECELTTKTPLGTLTVDVEVVDGAGEVISYGLAEITADKGLTPCLLTLDMAAIPIGEYVLRFEAYKEVGFDVASVNVGMLVQEEGIVGKAIADLSARYSVLVEHLESQDASSLNPLMAVRLQLAKMAIDQASRSDNLRAIHRLSDYCERLLDVTSAKMTFGSGELVANTMPRLDEVRAKNGALFAGAQPVFLAGLVYENIGVKDMQELHSLSLNYALLESDPRAVDPSIAEEQKRLQSVFSRAKETNIALSYSNISRDGDDLDYDKPTEAGSTTDRQFTARADQLARLARYLSQQDMVVSMGLASQPRFMYSDEQVRQNFITWLKERFPDRTALNRHWRARLAHFEDVPIWWDYGRRAYQYDWQMFHRELGTAHFAASKGLIRQAAPTLATHITLDGSFFTPGETRYGLDHKALAEQFGVAAVATEGAMEHPVFAMAYPNETMQYALFRSLNDKRPVMTSWTAPSLDDNLYSSEMVSGYVEAVLWEGAMEGLNALALSSRGSKVGPMTDAVSKLSIRDGLTHANFDLNRLMDVVYAFQMAPAELGIVLSNSSRILEGGSVHLESVLRAFEGSSFSGMKIRFVFESELAAGVPTDLEVLVIPQTPALATEAFDNLQKLIETDVVVLRPHAPISYNAWGQSRFEVLRYGLESLLIPGGGSPTEYLHALDEAWASGRMETPLHATNAFQYALEGVKTRSVMIDGERYLYLINLRKDTVRVHLTGGYISGDELIRGHHVAFPAVIEPLVPMLVRLDPADMLADSNEDPLGKKVDSGIVSAEVLAVETN